MIQTEANITIDSSDNANSTENSQPDKLANFFESIHHLVTNDAEMENFIHNDANFQKINTWKNQVINTT